MKGLLKNRPFMIMVGLFALFFIKIAGHEGATLIKQEVTGAKPVLQGQGSGGSVNRQVVPIMEVPPVPGAVQGQIQEAKQRRQEQAQVVEAPVHNGVRYPEVPMIPNGGSGIVPSERSIMPSQGSTTTSEVMEIHTESPNAPTQSIKEATIAVISDGKMVDERGHGGSEEKIRVEFERGKNN